MPRVFQLVLIASLLVNCWLGMQLVHELGHVLGAWLTGGHVARVVLHPLTFSRTDVAPNPHPLMVVWAGPIFGAFAPLGVWFLSHWRRWSSAFAWRFFAGFCLIANGGYLGIGSFSRSGDCEVLLHHGAAFWQLWLFGLITMPLGLMLWNGQGPQFGLGPTRGRVDHTVTCWSLATSGVLITIGLLSGS